MKSEYLEYILQDVFQGINGISTRAMFGGYGLYKEGIIFGLIFDDVLYFKVGPTNLEDYKALESTPFIYDHPSRTKKVTMSSFWSVPEEIQGDEDVLRNWIVKALRVSAESKKKKKSKKMK